MAEKRYYWLKFKEDFFDFKGVKKLRKLAGGDTYVIIYLKMLLRSLKTDGILEYTGIEKDFASELALDLDEDPENVSVVLAIITGCGMCEYSDASHIFLPYVGENTGSETASTQRVRDFRERQKALQCNADVTEVKRIGNVEKEIENRDRDKSKSKNTLAHPEVSGVVIEDPFDTFWREYPRKVGKGDARKKFAKALTKTSFDNIMAALQRVKASAQWTKDGGQFVPHPATWLNQERWEDEVDAPVEADKYSGIKKLMEETPDD